MRQRDSHRKNARYKKIAGYIVCKQHFFAARCPYVSNGKAREILEWNFAKKLNIYD
jgi:hypothetical protein